METRATKLTYYEKGSTTLRGSFLVSDPEKICKYTPPPLPPDDDEFIPDDSVTLPPIFPQKPTPTITPTETFTYSPTPTVTPTSTPTSSPTPTFTYTTTPTRPTLTPTYSPPGYTPTPTPTLVFTPYYYTDVGGCGYCCDKAPDPSSGQTRSGLTGYTAWTEPNTFTNWYRTYYVYGPGPNDKSLDDADNYTDNCCANTYLKSKWPSNQDVCDNIKYDELQKWNCRVGSYKFEWDFLDEGCGDKATRLGKSGCKGTGGSWPYGERYFLDWEICKGQSFPACGTCDQWDLLGNPCCTLNYGLQSFGNTGAYYQYGWNMLTGRGAGADCLCGWDEPTNHGYTVYRSGCKNGS